MTTATTWVTASTLLTTALCLTISSGCAPSYLTRASKSLEQNDYASAVSYLELGAQNNDRRCAFLLGSMLISGEGVDPDPTEGVRWMREAADAELPVAQAYLGTLYANGEGVEQDPATAAEWYLKAAEYGNPLAQAAFGAAAFYGMGVPVDPVEGYVWTKLAADQGFSKAIANLSEMSGALDDEQMKQAERKVARFHPKENEASDPNFNDNRPNRANNNLRRAGEGRAFRNMAHGAGGY